MEERIEKNWQFPQLLRTDVLPTTPTLILTPTLSQQEEPPKKSKYLVNTNNAALIKRVGKFLVHRSATCLKVAQLSEESQTIN